MAILTVDEAREYCRIPHREDDPAIQLAIDAAEAELERFAGIASGATTYTQYVDAYPVDGLLLLEKGPPYEAVYDGGGDDFDGTSAELQQRRGAWYAVLSEAATYPLKLSVTTTASTDAYVRQVLLARVAELVSRRGDDAAPGDAAYWKNAMAGIASGVG